MEKDHSEKNLVFYREQLNRAGNQKKIGSPLPWIEHLPEIIKQNKSNYRSLPFTNLETNLYNNLVNQFQHNKIEAAISCYRKAKEIAPVFYLGDLYLGNAMEQADM